MFLLILLPTKADLVFKKGYSKINLVSTLNSSSGKVIPILLIEVIAFYMRFITVYIWRVGFQGLVFLKKRYSKINLVSTLNSSSGKVIPILLIEVIAFYMRFITVYIWRVGFQGLVSNFFRGGGSSNFQNSLRIRYKLSLTYLRIKSTMARTTTTGRFTFRGQPSWLDNLLSDLGDGEKLGGAKEKFPL